MKTSKQQKKRSNIQTHRHIGTHIDTHAYTYRETPRQTHIDMDTWMYIHTCRCTEIHTYTYRETHRQTDRYTHAEILIYMDMHTHADTHRQTDTQTHIQRHIHTHADIHRNKHTHRHIDTYAHTYMCIFTCLSANTDKSQKCEVKMYLNIVSVGTIPHARVILSPLPLSPPCLVEPFPPGSTVAGDSHLLLSHIAHSEASGNGLSLKPAGNVSLLTSTRQSVESGLLQMEFLIGRLSYVMPGLSCAELAGHAGSNNRPSDWKDAVDPARGLQVSESQSLVPCAYLLIVC